MPELPEVETTRRGIEPHLRGRRIAAIRVREHRLRWPVPAALVEQLPGQRIEAVDRRAKYLLLRCEKGTVIVHLGMSGSLRILPADVPPSRHDHVDIILADEHMLRLRDPRRFGAVLWTEAPPQLHPLLARLGPEPREEAFDGDYLYRLSRRRSAAVKSFIMDATVVAGLGNIYANEALYLAGIHPRRAANRIGRARYHRLADAAKTVLTRAIAKGGTTLRHFLREDGHPGYFQLELQVYCRAGEACRRCGGTPAHTLIAQRSSYFCPRCQR